MRPGAVATAAASIDVLRPLTFPSKVIKSPSESVSNTFAFASFASKPNCGKLLSSKSLILSANAAYAITESWFFLSKDLTLVTCAVKSSNSVSKASTLVRLAGDSLSLVVSAVCNNGSIMAIKASAFAIAAGTFAPANAATSAWLSGLLIANKAANWASMSLGAAVFASISRSAASLKASALTIACSSRTRSFSIARKVARCVAENIARRSDARSKLAVVAV